MRETAGVPWIKGLGLCPEIKSGLESEEHSAQRLREGNELEMWRKQWLGLPQLAV